MPILALLSIEYKICESVDCNIISVAETKARKLNFMGYICEWIRIILQLAVVTGQSGRQADMYNIIKPSRFGEVDEYQSSKTTAQSTVFFILSSWNRMLCEEGDRWLLLMASQLVFILLSFILTWTYIFTFLHFAPFPYFLVPLLYGLFFLFSLLSSLSLHQVLKSVLFLYF